mgnify:CR=1 FL=1
MSTHPSTNPRKRASAIKVSLTPALHADLVAVSEAIGQTPATAASVAIGMWVAQQKRTLTAGETAMAALMDRAAPELIDQMKQLVSEVKAKV